MDPHRVTEAGGEEPLLCQPSAGHQGFKREKGLLIRGVNDYKDSKCTVSAERKHAQEIGEGLMEATHLSGARSACDGWTKS